MEKAAGQWSRNLYLSSGYVSLEEYVVAYGQNPWIPDTTIFRSFANIIKRFFNSAVKFNNLYFKCLFAWKLIVKAVAFLEKLNNFVEKYKKLSLVDKKIAIEKEIKETLALLEKLHEKLGKENDILFNKEVLDVKDGVSSEEDFVEAMFVYVLTIQESLASYVDLIDKK